MSNPSKLLGIMKPLGGGDPVPLRKEEMIIGRRPSCDIQLDFENVSGKHCVLRFIHQIWHVRDLGSTNGTKVNGSPIPNEHSLMPDDELGIAGHLFKIDYEPGAPESILSQHQMIEDEMYVAPKRTSLMELAGLDTDTDRPKRPTRATKPPALIERLSVDEAEFEDELPAHVKAKPAPKPKAKSKTEEDDDFLKIFE